MSDANAEILKPGVHFELITAPMHSGAMEPVAYFRTFKELNGYYLENPAFERRNWVFRGQRESWWPLQSTLERALARFGLPLRPEDADMPKICDQKTALLAIRGYGDFPQLTSQERDSLKAWAKDRRCADNYEAQMVREFQRKAKSHFATTHLPANRDEYMLWLALMQHFEAPTRLLDWTYSFYVALYFAISEYQPGTRKDGTLNEFCIWAIHSNTLDDVVLNPENGFWSSELRKLKDTDRGERNKRLMNLQLGYAALDESPVNIPAPSVVTMTPFDLNERLSVQQGTFIATSFASVSFEESLARVLDVAARTILPPSFFKKIVCRFDMMQVHIALEQLKRMNLTPASLFTGQSGFTRSIGQSLALDGFRKSEDPFKGLA